MRFAAGPAENVMEPFPVSSSAHRPSIEISLCFELCSVSIRVPVFASKALMRPSPKLPTSNVPARAAEIRRRNCQAPGSVQRAVCDERLHKFSLGREHVDIAEALSIDLIVAVLFTQGESDIELAVEDRHIEGRVALRQIPICKCLHQRKRVVADLDLVVVEVGREDLVRDRIVASPL